MTTMRAFQIDQAGPASELKLVMRETPHPGPGEVRLRVAYCGLNPLDIIVRSGGAAWMAPGWPFTPGVEHSGVIDMLGDGVDPDWLGRGVVSAGAAFGGNADFTVIKSTKVLRLDDDIDLLTGAVYHGCSHTAWRLINETVHVRSGDWAVFHSAAGPVGIMLTQFAKQIGLNVIGLVGGSAKAAYAREFGADHLIDTREGPWSQTVMALTAGKGAALIVDGVAGPQSPSNLDVVAPGGEVVFIGATSGAPAALVAPGLLIVKHAAIRGFNLPVAEGLGAPTAEVDRRIVGLLRSGELKAPITSVSPFEAIPELHRQFENRMIHGRAVIEIGGEAVERQRRRRSTEAH